MMNARPLFIMEEATSAIVGTHHTNAPYANNLMAGKQALRTVGMGIRWLFPQPDVVEGAHLAGHDILEHEWNDPGLNQEQRVGPV